MAKKRANRAKSPIPTFTLTGLRLTREEAFLLFSLKERNKCPGNQIEMCDQWQYHGSENCDLCVGGLGFLKRFPLISASMPQVCNCLFIGWIKR